MKRLDFPNLEAMAEGVLDLADFSGFSIETWWDPMSEDWSGDKVKEALTKAITGTTAE